MRFQPKTVTIIKSPPRRWQITHTAHIDSTMSEKVLKNMLYVGGLAEEVNESVLHVVFIPFGDIKDVKTPLDQATPKHRSFRFVTFVEREDGAATMDGAELYGGVLTVNYALAKRINGDERGWAIQPGKLILQYICLQREQEMQAAEESHRKEVAEERKGEEEESDVTMAKAEAEILKQNAGAQFGVWQVTLRHKLEAASLSLNSWVVVAFKKMPSS